MDGSLGQFKATLQRRKERQEKNRSRFNNGQNQPAPKSLKTQYNIPKISKKELKKIKFVIKVKKEGQLIKEGIIFGIVIIVGIVLTVLFV